MFLPYDIEWTLTSNIINLLIGNNSRPGPSHSNQSYENHPKTEYPESSGETGSESESDVTEDEDGTELTPALDAAILRTLSKIKRKEEGVYGDANVLEEELRQAQERAGKLGLTTGFAQKSKDKVSPFTSFLCLGVYQV